MLEHKLFLLKQKNNLSTPLVHHTFNGLHVFCFTTQLMESKWFTETPEDFETDWCTVVCPVGQRCLVVALDVSKR